MTAREWKPGDVARVNGSVAVRADDNLSWWTTSGRLSDCNVAYARPLVVIDPESERDLDRLRLSLSDSGWHPDSDADDLDDILREFANPTGPKPEEPLRAASLVEDSDGGIWARQCTRSHDLDMSSPWLHVVNGRVPGPILRERSWADIDAVRVLSEGVQP